MSEQKLISNVTSQLMNYPKDGSRKLGAQAGKYVFDLVSGVVNAPNGDTEFMSNSLSKLGLKFASSVYISISTVDATIKIGNQVLPKNQQLTYVVNGISFDTMEITFPSDRTPKDDFSIQVIASGSSIFPIDADVLTGLHNPTPQTGNTTNNFVTVFDFLFTGFTQINIIIENTGGTNVMEATVELSQDGSNWVSAQGFPIDVAINDATLYQNSIKHRFIRVRVKAKNAGNQTTFRVQPNLER